MEHDVLNEEVGHTCSAGGTAGSCLEMARGADAVSTAGPACVHQEQQMGCSFSTSIYKQVISVTVSLIK